MGIASIFGVFTAVDGCARHDPPSPDVSPSVAQPELPPTTPTDQADEAGMLTVSNSVPGPAEAAPAGANANANANEEGTLPQTRAVPREDGAAFDGRVAELWAAIENDAPDRARAFFFPLPAYEQVKDVANPAADWKGRLLAAYARDIHALHRRLGLGLGLGLAMESKPRLLGLDVPHARARWVEPGEEYNKIGYYRVFGSRLRYEAAGQERSFDVKSLISWRGEWYVVHLSAIK